MNRIVCLSIVSVFAAGLVVSAQARQIRQREDVLLDVLVWGLHMAPRQGEVYPDNLKADIDAYLRRAADSRRDHGDGP
jgi:hypothetical protein